MISALVETLQKEVPVSAADVALIAKHSRVKRYQRGEVLLQGGEVPQEVFFVLSGALHQFYVEETGTEHTCNFTFEREFVTDLEAFQKRIDSPSTIQAMTDATVLCISHQDFTLMLAESPAVAEYFRVLVARIAEQGIKRTKLLLSSSPEKRFIEFTREQPDLLRRVPQRYVAQYLGMTPESLSRIKKRLMTSEKS
ncbi:cAMP-binding domain of CRP or a regulatory subunit of cAMP-dependent protein kinases [Dyadobacter soli]|uniref:cAMP-binding domain of CRP or a regulatory subunit of cAMP-dependent protein kinases n=1 Tax=Dyadobacter soli TaxID=659014 RepID=A0A1G7SLA3_9BACT|nr:Crp/Fnr family transcriptional regulator [Dyadobacter soli]SDG23845.1 cAMP-binding domain of CRP or a regulatory subunit of cAMP-dependent protein kinases [Dyadobacter soli]